MRREREELEELRRERKGWAELRLERDEWEELRRDREEWEHQRGAEKEEVRKGRALVEAERREHRWQEQRQMCRYPISGPSCSS